MFKSSTKAVVTGASEDTEVPLMLKMPSMAKGVIFKEFERNGDTLTNTNGRLES